MPLDCSELDIEILWFVLHVLYVLSAMSCYSIMQIKSNTVHLSLCSHGLPRKI